MATFLSPEVVTNEVDTTGIIPSVSTSIGALAGVFNWGPVLEPTLVISEDDLYAQFGGPSNRNAETWFTGANFLAYADKLYVCRSANTTDTANGTISAIANTAAPTNSLALSTVLNHTDFTNKNGTFDSNIQFVAKYPGALGNSLRVSQCDTVNGYSSSIALTTANVTGSGTITVGANTATIVFTPVGNNAVSVANTQAGTVLAGLVPGDYITFGNTSIGTQSLKITSLPSVVSSNSTTAYFTVNFANPYYLRSNTSFSTINRQWEFASLVGVAPGTSKYAKTYNANTSVVDELHIVVVDDGGAFSGVPGTVLETWKSLSRATDAQSDNSSTIYYQDLINGSSKYIWSVNPRTGAPVANAASVVTATDYTKPVMNLRFNSGRDGYGEADENSLPDTFAAYSKFRSKDDIIIDLVMTGKSLGGLAGELLPNYIIDNVVLNRLDCVAFSSLPYATVINNVGSELSSAVTFAGLLRDTSYRFTDTGYKWQEDRYNGVYRWIPLNGDIAGLAARTDQTKDPWWSFAGFNRGGIKNVVKLAWSPSKAKRDILYPLNINSVVTFTGEGTYLYGDKTGQSKASAFDRINVRRLFIVLERAISKAAKYYLFELNDTFSRASFKNMVIPFLKKVQGRRGITDFVVVCDESNNSGSVVDANEFIADLYIKPSRAVNYIQLNFVAVGTDVSFNTVVGAW